MEKLQGMKATGHGRYEELTDEMLKVIKIHMPALASLVLSGLPELTNEGVAELFNEWDHRPLTSINFSRCHDLSSEALSSLLEHSSSYLTYLNINSLSGRNVEQYMNT